MADEAPTTTVNERFADAVTNQAFALTLSRQMVAMLVDVIQVADAGGAWRGYGTGALSGLERRGLVVIVRNGPEEATGGQRVPGLSFVPTLAGRLMLELCRQAGLVSGGDGAGEVVAEARRRDAEQAERVRRWDIEAAEVAERNRQELAAAIKWKHPRESAVTDPFLVNVKDPRHAG